jgi:thiol:disulfide interchange protein DsbD
LAIACGVYLRALEPLPEGISPWWRLWKALGLIMLLVGALELVGAAAGGDYWVRPLDSFRSTGMGAAEDKTSFQRIKSLDDLKQAIDQAGAQSKGVMLDFYADWCVECRRMERNTFHHPEVQALMNQMQPLQADVTANDTVDQELLSAFGIIGPPAILFFDRNGEEMKPWRLVGYFPPDEFATHLTSVLTAQ